MPRRSCGPRVRPSPTTSRSRAPRASTRSRAITSSPTSPSTSACSIPAGASGALAGPLIVGFGRAAELAKDEMAAEAIRLTALRDRLYRGITSKLPEVYVNGTMEHRLPGSLNISFAFVEGESLLMALKDVAVSSGSACTSASLEPSYVLRALGAGDDLAHSSIRFGIGRFSAEEQLGFVIDLVVKAVKRLRELSPLYEMLKEGIELNSIQWTPH